MRIYLPALEIDEMEGFTKEKDLFDRAPLGQGMSNIVAQVDDPLVISFDGAWGSGKTTFLKMWAGELRKAGHPVIFFDAFENDYVEDAFAALARELIDLLETHTAEDEAFSADFKKKAIELGGMLLRGATKVGLRAAVRIGTAGLVAGSDVEEAVADATREVEAIADHYMEQMLEAPRRQRETVHAFRMALQELPGLIAPPEADQKQKPLIYIIDELDRCKPVFALAILERIKHFMSVPNVHFVLGVHLRQLEGSVRFAYGADVDARRYLQKFINIYIENYSEKLRNQDDDLTKYANYIINNSNFSQEKRKIITPIRDVVVRISREHQITLRTLEKVFTIISLSLAFTNEPALRSAPLIGGLVMMKVLSPDLYLKAKKGELELAEAQKFLRFESSKKTGVDTELEETWWTYVLSNPTPVDLEEFARNLRLQYSIRNPTDFMKIIANRVIDAFSLE